MEKERLHNFLTDDLKKLEYHTNKIIKEIYESGGYPPLQDIEAVEDFFFYWEQHINKLK